MSEMHTPPAGAIPRERLCPNDNLQTEGQTPREANNYNSLLSSSSTYRKDQGSGWQVPHSLDPMADHQRATMYDSPLRIGDMYQPRQEVNHGPSREQLPPLSSIFAGSRPGIPMRSPYGDRSPAYPLMSPQHPPQTPALTIQEHQSWETAYPRPRPSPPTPLDRPYSMGAAPYAELPQHPHHSIHATQASHSPRSFDSRYSPKDGIRSQLPLSRGGWSPRSEPSYREYFPPASRDTLSSFRPLIDQHRSIPQQSGSQTESSYKETSNGVSPTQKFASSPGSTTTSESVNNKDGLGPKIWTGTQFLPRFVRQAEVPGEGLCYFYDDGTHCKTHIDGEAVNAHWGVTKAGKPRKRLAIACITCREKKIKCDPDYPRCTQCEKFGRVCKFKNAPRGGQGSPEISPEAEDSSTRAVSQPSNDGSINVEKREDLRSFNLQNSHGQSSSDSDEVPAKRAKYGHAAPQHRPSEDGPYHQKSSPRQVSTSMDLSPSEQITRQWSIDPLDTDKELVMDLMRLYFIQNGASGVHCMFPEKQFMLWFTNQCVKKSPNDLMLIYTMLALASVFSSDVAHKNRGKDFEAVARYACDQSQYSLQLVQSRLLLALYYYANNSPNDSWDFCGSAIRAAIGIKLNLELEKLGGLEGSDHPYNLHRDGYAECRRRTFWACYILDRLNGFCSGHMSIINPEDVFLRLPCDIKSFEAQIEVNNPYFNHSIKRLDHISTMGVIAHLINICSIWGDVMTNVYRTSQRPENADEDATKILAFHSTSTARLEDWSSSLPGWLAFSPDNLAKASTNGTLGSFITAHSLYHSAQMKLNRHTRPDMTPTNQLERNIRTAYNHAEALLLMAEHIAARSKIAEANNPFSAPFIGYAIVSAIDIISAKGYLSSLPLFPSKVRGAMTVMTELSAYWQSARNQKEMIVSRNADLVAGPAGWKGFFEPRDYVKVMTDTDHGDRPREGDGGGPQTTGRKQLVRQGTFEMKTPIETNFKKGNDCLYAVPLEVWDRALEVKGI